MPARAFGGHIIVGLDAKDGKVATDGWSKLTGHEVVDLAREVRGLGVESIIYTDIGRDGMLSGINIEATVKLAQALTIPVIASGGLASMADIEQLCAVESEGVEGVILRPRRSTRATWTLPPRKRAPTPWRPDSRRQSHTPVACFRPWCATIEAPSGRVFDPRVVARLQKVLARVVAQRDHVPAFSEMNRVPGRIGDAFGQGLQGLGTKRVVGEPVVQQGERIQCSSWAG